jgi:hypothetical protein
VFQPVDFQHTSQFHPIINHRFLQKKNRKLPQTEPQPCENRTFFSAAEFHKTHIRHKMLLLKGIFTHGTLFAFSSFVYQGRKFFREGYGDL